MSQTSLKMFRFLLHIHFLDHNLAVIGLRSPVSAFSGLETFSPQGAPRDTKNYFRSAPRERRSGNTVLDHSLHSAHTVLAGVLYVSQNKQQLLPVQH